MASGGEGLSRGVRMTESQIQDAIRLELSGKVLTWRNNIGRAQTRTGAYITYGVGNPGGADLIGLYRGRFVAIEIKTPIGRQSREQKMFQALVEAHGGIYVVLRSVEDARAWCANLADL